MRNDFEERLRQWLADFLEQISNNSQKSNQKSSLSLRNIFFALSGAILVFALATSLYTVDESQQAVITRLGRLNRIENSGLRIKLPFFIEQAHKVPVNLVQQMSFGYLIEEAGIKSTYSRGDFSKEMTMITGDLNLVEVEFLLQFRIKDPYSFLFKIEDPLQTLEDISRSVMNQLVGDHSIFSTINQDRDTISLEAQQRIDSILSSYSMGIEIVRTELRSVLPPRGSVLNSFEDVNVAMQDKERLDNEGREQYNQSLSKAQGESRKLIAQAEGYRQKRINEARGDVSHFNAVLREYRLNPSVTRQRLYYETLEEIFQGTKTHIIDKNLENFLPLQDLSRPQQ